MLQTYKRWKLVQVWSGVVGQSLTYYYYPSILDKMKGFGKNKIPKRIWISYSVSPVDTSPSDEYLKLLINALAPQALDRGIASIEITQQLFAVLSDSISIEKVRVFLASQSVN